MRPLRLEMEGFGTFSRHTVVDFTDADFFALVGPTGAGKSTVMDAICFALYGRVPRWGQGIEYALAPSATSGKVQLVFAAADRVYVATRVVKRGGKGRVTTSSAALERLPADVRPGGIGDVSGLMGTSLAGSAKALTEQVERIVGLPFEQFTKCVLLPQGAFADFLHASAAERRKILENLLGHSVYRDIQVAAGEEHRAAEAVLSHMDSQLSRLTPVTDEDLTAASERITVLSALDKEVRDALPRLEELARRASETESVLKVVDEEHSLLTYIRRPSDVDSIADELAATAADIETARAEVTLREEAEERLRHAAADTDVARIEQTLGDYAAAAELAGSIAKGTPLTEEAEHRLAQAEAAVASAEVHLAQAEAAHQAARDADLAATLRRQLHEGDDCPVCGNPVTAASPHPGHDALADAAAEEEAARESLRAARAELVKAQQTAAQYRGRLDERLDQQRQLRERLATAPPEEELRDARDAARRRSEELTAAAAAVRIAREDARRAERAHRSVLDRQTAEWQRFDHHRDRVARLGPPATDRSDLRAGWDQLTEWATAQLDVRRRRRADELKARDELDAQTRVVRNELVARLTEAGVTPPPSGGAEDFTDVVTAALHRARHDLDTLTAQRRQYISLSEQRAAQAQQAEVARQLHRHLGTKNFVNWLLSEAVEDLVAGASRILHQLTGGQYELISEETEFYVVDHHDADLTRPVKTLSGGETFAAALSLALAMSDQLAGMSSEGACLEAILLDEGFGTLDAATLDQVAANLESLATSGGRMVGVVTHVAGLAERIPVRFEVGKNASGSHVTRVDV
ncbi:exonuclease SbcC [Stackebrandtia albiflava]|uniref:Nuclease SbcCD subunit C n=1 Tax=Stackebrandtia albiflava TaxID=406432 RepID=A0A562VBI9_9ACTN|nr:SMC family ATPase [Stackebrandtia albiflava]TWJ15254.1 exonuclease SbcC [Stackebrandtia albiflava]